LAVRRPGFVACALLLGLCLFAIGRAHAADRVVAGAFSRADPAGVLPPGWSLLTFRGRDRHTDYRLVSDGGAVVLEAHARAAAAALVREVRFDPVAYPWLEWRWRVVDRIPASDARRREGDDYPARVYVSFGERGGGELGARLLRWIYGRPVPQTALNYIWAEDLAVGTVLPNAYTDSVRMVVVGRGAEGLGEWRTARRNLLEDYRLAFGAEPPPVTGVGLMTDTDNTGAEARAYYGDIFFGPGKPHARGGESQ